jgi:hypothetical protein
MIYAIALIILSQAGSADLARLFTPERPRVGHYDVAVADEPLERAIPDGLRHGPAEWLEPLDAFGAAGRYNRSKLVRLYGGRRVETLRGWRMDGDRLESVTLLSPYPDASLTKLEPGTMIITLTIQRKGR